MKVILPLIVLIAVREFLPSEPTPEQDSAFAFLVAAVLCHWVYLIMRMAIEQIEQIYRR